MVEVVDCGLEVVEVVCLYVVSKNWECAYTIVVPV
jgi:hypothetical protein